MSKSPRSSVSTSAFRPTITIEGDGSSGKIAVAWKDHTVTHLRLTWTPTSGSKQSVDLSHLNHPDKTKDLQELADHIYDMYKDKFEAAVSGTPALSSVGMQVKSNNVETFTGARAAFTKDVAQRVYNIARGIPLSVGPRSRPEPHTPSSGSINPGTPRSMHSRRVSVDDHSVPGSPGSVITGVATPRIAASGELDRALARIAALEEELRDVKDDLEGAIDGRAHAEGELRGLRDSFRRVEAELHDAKAQRDEAIARVNALTADNATLTERLRGSDAALASIRTQLDEKDATITALRRSLDTARDRVLELAVSKARAEALVESLRVQIERLEDRIQTLEAAEDGTAEEIRGLRRELGEKSTALAVATSGLGKAREDLAVAQQTIREKEEIIVAKDRRIQEQEAQISDFRLEIVRLGGVVSHLESVLGDKDREINRLTHEGTASRANIEGLTTERDGAIRELAAARAQLAVLQARLGHATETIKDLRGQIRTKDRTIRRQAARLERQQEQLNDKSEEITGLKAHLAQLGSDLHALQTNGRKSDQGEIRQLTADVARLTALVTEKESALSRQTLEHDAAVTDLRRALEASEAVRLRAIADRDEALGSLQRLSATLSGRGEEIRQLQQQVVALETTLGFAERKNATSEKDLRAKEADITRLRAEISDLMARNSGLLGEKVGMFAELGSARQQIGFLQYHLGQAGMIIHNQELTIDYLARKIDSKEANVIELRRQLDEAVSARDEALAELDELRLSDEAKGEALARAQEDLDEANDRIGELEAELGAVTQERNELLTRVSDLEAEVGSLTDANSALRAEGRRKAAKIRDLRRSNRGLLSNLIAKRRELGAVKEHLRELETRIHGLSRLPVGDEADGGSPPVDRDALSVLGEIEGAQERLRAQFEEMRAQKETLEADLGRILEHARTYSGVALGVDTISDGIATELGRDVDREVSKLIRVLGERDEALALAQDRNHQLTEALEAAGLEVDGAKARALTAERTTAELTATLDALRSSIRGDLDSTVSPGADLDVGSLLDRLKAQWAAKEADLRARISKIEEDVARRISAAVAEEKARAEAEREPLDLKIRQLEAQVSEQATQLAEQAERLQTLEGKALISAREAAELAKLKADILGELGRAGKTLAGTPTSDEIVEAVRNLIAEKNDVIAALKDEVRALRAANSALTDPSSGQIARLETALRESQAREAATKEKLDEATVKLTAISSIVESDDPVAAVRALKQQLETTTLRLVSLADEVPGLQRQLEQATATLKIFLTTLAGKLGGRFDTDALAESIMRGENVTSLLGAGGIDGGLIEAIQASQDLIESLRQRAIALKAGIGFEDAGKDAGLNAKDAFSALEIAVGIQQGQLTQSLAQINELQGELVLARKGQSDAQAAFNAAMETIASQTEKLEAARGVEAEVISLRGQLVNLHGEKVKVDGEVVSLSKQLVAAKARIIELEGIIRQMAVAAGVDAKASRAIGDVIGDLKSVVGRHKTDLEAVLSEQAVLQDTILSLAQGKAAAESKVKELEGDLAQLQRTALSLRSELEAHRSETAITIAAFTRELEALGKQVEAQKASHESSSAASRYAHEAAKEATRQQLLSLLRAWDPSISVPDTITSGDIIAHLEGALEAQKVKYSALEAELSQEKEGRAAAEAKSAQLESELRLLNMQLRGLLPLGGGDSVPSTAISGADDSLGAMGGDDAALGGDLSIVAALRARIDVLIKEKRLADEEIVQRNAALREAEARAVEAAREATAKYEALLAENEALKRELSDSRDESAELRAALKAFLGKMRGSPSGVDLDKLSITQLQRQLDSTSADLNRLLDEAQAARLNAESALRLSEAEVVGLRSTLDLANERIATLEAENVALRSKVSGLQSQNDLLKADNLAQASTIESLRLSLSGIQAKLEASEARERALEVALASAKADASSKQLAIEALTAALTKLRAEKAAGDSSLNERIRDLDAELEAAIKLQDEQKEEIARLTSELAVSSAHLAGVRAELGLSAGDDLSDALKAQTRKINDLEAANSGLRAENNRLDRELRAITAERDRLQTELAEALAAFSGTSGSAVSGSLADKIADLKGQLAVNKASQEALEEFKVRLSAKNLGLEAELATALADIEALNKLLTDKEATISALSGRVSMLEVEAGEVPTLRDRIKELEAELGTAQSRISQLARAALPKVDVTLSIDAAVDLSGAALIREMAAFEATAARVVPQIIARAPGVDMAASLEALIRAIPKAVASASLEALMSEEVVRGIDLYENALELLLQFKGDQTDLLLNLMLVVANHKGEVSERAKGFLRAQYSVDATNIRLLQVLAQVAMGEERGYLSDEIVGSRTSIPLDKVAIQATIEPLITRFDDILEARDSHMDDDARARLKQIALGSLRRYLALMGFVSSSGTGSDEGIAALAHYVKTHEGALPPALSRFLASSDRENHSLHFCLSKMLYQYTACDTRSRGVFFDIASTQDLEWLSESKPLNNEKSDDLLRFIARTTPDVAFTRKQVRAWGKQVEALRQGEPIFPIHGEGGSGKTVTVLHFAKLLKDIHPEDDAPYVFVSPFGHRTDPSSGVVHVMLPPAQADCFILDVGNMSRAQLSKAKIIIDEAHLIRPGMRIILKNTTGEQVEIKDGKYLPLTASPLSVGYDLEKTFDQSLRAVNQEISELESLLLGPCSLIARLQVKSKSVFSFLTSG